MTGSKRLLSVTEGNIRFSVGVVYSVPLKKCYKFIKVFRHAKYFMTEIVNLLPQSARTIFYMLEIANMTIRDFM